MQDTHSSLDVYFQPLEGLLPLFHKYQVHPCPPHFIEKLQKTEFNWKEGCVIYALPYYKQNQILKRD